MNGLSVDELHIWKFKLSIPAEEVNILEKFLVADEVEKANRFVFPLHQKHYIVARGMLRKILAQYLDIAPGEVQFQYGKHGKPFVADTNNQLQFNLSHAHEYALVAVTWQREVGIDIEYTGKDVSYRNIARRFFSPTEVAILEDLSENLQRQAFFICWTRKEAYIKARGDGLSFPLNRFDVALIPGKPPFLSNREDPDENMRWAIANIEAVPDDYEAALVVEGSLPKLVYFSRYCP